MNDVTVAAATKKNAPEVETVKMTDGRLVDFPGKKVLQKESFEDGDSVYIRLDFRNGETRTVTLRPDMLKKYAAHGGEQKLGDEIAGLKKEDGTEADTDDKVLVIDALIERLNAGEWTTKRDASGMAGTSVLLRAIVNVTGKSLESIKAFLKDKTQAQKLALRDSTKFRAEVAKIEAEKASKKAKVDIADIEAELENIPA